MSTKKNIEQPNAENPEELLQLKLTKPKEVAAGIPAVISSANTVKMGPRQ